MKSPLDDFYTSDPVSGDQEPVFNTGLPDPANFAQPAPKKEESKLTSSHPDIPQETEPNVSEDQSYREIIQGIRSYMDLTGKSLGFGQSGRSIAQDVFPLTFGGTGWQLTIANVC